MYTVDGTTYAVDISTGSRAVVEGQETKPLPMLLKDRDKERLAAYRSNLYFYAGQQYPLAPRQPRLRRVTINYVQATIDKVASYVLSGSKMSIRPINETEGDTAAHEAEMCLDDCAHDNGLERLDYVSEIDCSVMGDGCYRLAWDDAEKRVTITAPDVAGIFVWPHPTDPMRIRRIAHRYQLPKQDIYDLWRVGTTHDPCWVTEDWRDGEHGVWIGDDAKYPQVVEANPYGFVPFIVYPNCARPKTNWGRSDVETLVPIATELNAEFSRISNIVELSGNPIAVVSGVESAEGIESFPGATWALPEGAKADLLDLLRSGSVTQHLSYLAELRTAFYDLAETPKSAFGGTGGRMSGVALEIDLLPLLQRVARKRAIRAEVYETRAGMCLAMMDQFTGTNYGAAGRPEVTWSQPTPRDRAREVDTESQAVAAHLTSIESAMERLGDTGDVQAELAQIRAETDLVNSAPAKLTQPANMDGMRGLA